ncbi:NAD(P)-dependent oxidoreductase [Ensifer adhaerens]|uniref:NAD(P)-dependent oxidoreductase n=1 Tax=Ensifer adhaerens TaxID=106592 RepID=UPI000FDB0769|nr:NAD(P)-dependent oxidoreductase [Ensifer adhaerens]MDF8357651.1 NAD(P)-dependent oxidoreductase [Ensifer adhaerens]THA60204.1 NAD(P)-dependent oxidoreductase [Ensifer adhaerens]
MNILWIGFGKMGEPMAGRLAAAGYRVIVHDASAERMATAAAQGFAPAKDPRAYAGEADIVICSLPNDAVVTAVLGIAEGLVAGMKPSTLLIDTSTISVAASAKVQEAAARQGVLYVRAPVSGTVDAAAAGRLTSLISGPQEALALATDIVRTYSAAVVVVGDGDKARVMKLAINLMVTTVVASLAEAYALCCKGGIDPAIALKAIGDSAVGTPHLRAKASALDTGDFKPSFTVAQICKDMTLISDAARGLGVPLLVGGAVDQIMTASAAAGFGDEDYIACTKIVSRLAGLTDRTA